MSILSGLFNLTIADINGLTEALEGVEVTDQSADYTLTTRDAGTVIRFTGESAAVLTVPPHADVAFPEGTVIVIYQDGAGQVTVAAGAGVTLDGEMVKTAAQNALISLTQPALDEWALTGDLA
jgi:hypothetical protein